MSQPPPDIPMPPSEEGPAPETLSSPAGNGLGPPPIPVEVLKVDRGAAPKEMAWMPKAPPTKKGSFKRRAIVVGSSLALTLALVTTLKFAFLPPEFENCWPSAERFISLLKHGEDPVQEDPDERIGYALAHEMFTEGLKDECSFVEFFQTFARLSRDHGDIMASESLDQRRVQGDARRRDFRYLLYFGQPRQSTQEMSPFTVHLKFVQSEGEYLLDDWRIEPARSER